MTTTVENLNGAETAEKTAKAGKTAEKGLASGGVNLKKANPLELTIIGVDTKHVAGQHPLFDARAFDPLDEALVLSIMARGVKVPVIVRKDGQDFQVVDGRQRVRATREANIRLGAQGLPLLRVPVMVEDSDDRMAVNTMVLTNEIRRADTAYNKAVKAKQLVDMGTERKDVATAFGVTGQTIDLWVKALSCDQSVLDALREGKLRMSAAREFVTMSREEQRATLAELLANLPPKVETPEEDGHEEEDDGAEHPRASSKGGEVTMEDVRSAKKERKTRDKDPEEKGQRISKVAWTRLARLAQNEDDEIHKKGDFKDGTPLATLVTAIRVMNGEVSPVKIAGLKAILRYLDERFTRKEEE